VKTDGSSSLSNKTKQNIVMGTQLTMKIDFIVQCVVFNVCVQASFSPGLLKSISRCKAKGGFFLLGAGGLVGVVGVSVLAGGGGGAGLGCVSGGVGSLVSGVGWSWDERVGSTLLGSGSAFGTRRQV